MHPILFKFGPITIYSYGFMLFIAVLTAFSLLARQAHREGFQKDTILDLGIVILLSGIVGARILYVVLNLEFFIRHPKEIFMIHHGGLAILGGLFFATVAASIFIKLKKLHFLKTADLVIPFVVLAQSIGRIGCFFNGCCYGLPSKFGIYFPVHNAVLIPTQIISSFLLLILYIVLRIKQNKPHSTGSIFVTYILSYSTMRFFVEFIRADSPRLFLGLTTFQYFCVVFFVAGLVLFLTSKKISKDN